MWWAINLHDGCYFVLWIIDWGQEKRKMGDEYTHVL